MGNFTYNIGHTFNSDNTGKTTGRATINFGNGLRYQKHKTFNSSPKPSLPNITAETLEASIYQTPEYTNCKYSFYECILHYTYYSYNKIY